MRKIISSIAALLLLTTSAVAQTNTFPATGAAGIGTTTPHASSLLEVKSTAKGVLLPRMTKVQRDAIGSPATGLLIYQTNSTPGFYYYTGSAWKPISSKGANTALSNLAATTKINASLLPKTDNTIDLGAASFRWRNIYAANLFLSSDATINGITVGLGGGALQGNTAVGNTALQANSVGLYNTATGYQSLYANTEGHYNTANGSFTLYNNTTGSNNMASGNNALYYNTTGSYNVAVGEQALYSAQQNSNNVAIGAYALHNYNDASYEDYMVAVGVRALLNNTTGFFNTALGGLTLQNNTTGYYNTAAGVQALINNTTGYYNTATGTFALQSSTTGYGNTALGFYALSRNTTGIHNTAIGYSANVGDNNLSNATAIGYNAMVDASNKVRVGNTGVTSIGGQVGWTSFSDGRFKKDIKENVPGLAFINSLRPITYTVNVKGLDEYYKTGIKVVAADSRATMDDKTEKAATEKASAAIYTGFVAQEVEKAAQKLNFTFSGVDKPESKDGVYGLRYDNFVAPLVRAVQELSKQNDEKNAVIDELKTQNQHLENRLAKLEAMMHAGSSINSQQFTNVLPATLLQNIPNPVSRTTTIGYTIPQQYASAKIVITDQQGKVLKEVSLAPGKGNVNVDVSTLAAGIYQYTLYVDGKWTDSKSMMVAK